MCYKPITVFHDGIRYNVPCGKCLACVETYQRHWSLRLEAESTQWRYVYFLTLTYRNDSLSYVNLDSSVEQEEYLIKRISSLPVTRHLKRLRSQDTEYTEYVRPERVRLGILVPTVSKSDIQGYFKRARRSYFYEHGCNMPLAYFCCSEYGPSTLRPHYHILLFTELSVAEVTKYFVSPWIKRFGNVKWKHKPLKYYENGYKDPCEYVAKYCAKPAFIENPFVVAKCVFAPFRLMSKGLGKCGRKRFENIHKFRPAIFRGNAWRDRNGICGVSRSYLDWFHRRISVFTDDGTFMSNPRYWTDFAFPLATKISKYYDKKKKCYVLRERVAKSSCSQLSVAYQNYLLQLINEEYQRRALAKGATLTRYGLSVPASVDSDILMEDTRRKRERIKRCAKFYYGKLSAVDGKRIQ